MTIYTLPSVGAVTVTTAHTASAVVGGPPQWADDSDATHATVATTYGVVDVAKSRVAPLPAPIDTSKGDTYAWVRIRLAATNTVGEFTNNNIHCELWNTATGQMITWEAYGPTDRELHHVNFEFNPDDNQAIADALAADVVEARVFAEYVDVNPGYEYNVTVYELEVRVSGEAARGQLPPLRQDLCRDDHRVWPVSSQQASLRRLGGYY